MLRVNLHCYITTNFNKALAYHSLYKKNLSFIHFSMLVNFTIHDQLPSEQIQVMMKMERMNGLLNCYDFLDIVIYLKLPLVLIFFYSEETQCLLMHLLVNQKVVFLAEIQLSIAQLMKFGFTEEYLLNVYQSEQLKRGAEWEKRRS